MHCEAQKVIFKYELCFSVQVDRNPAHCFSEAQKIISVRVPPVFCFSETRLTLWVSRWMLQFLQPLLLFSWHKKYFSSLKFTAQLNFCATHNKVFFWDANNSFCTCKFYSFPDHHSNKHKKLCLHVNLTAQLTFRAIPRLLLLGDAKNQCLCE